MESMLLFFKSGGRKNKLDTWKLYATGTCWY